MASFWVVGAASMLWHVTNSNPGFGIETANGLVPVAAVGIALVWLLLGDKWECYEIPNVLLLDDCPAVLYSTRVMHSLFKFSHDTDGGRIHVPGTPGITITDDGAAYSIPVAFVHRGDSRPRNVHRAGHTQPTAMMVGNGAAFPVSLQL